MKQIFLAIALAFLASASPAGHAQGTPPLITQTAGTGSNTSYFVINFNDGPGNSNSLASDYVFAYHWADGSSATGETMLADLDRLTSPRLQVNQTYYSSFDAYFLNGFTYLSHSQTGYYNSGADQASWTYWVRDGGAWAQPQAYGVSGRALSNGSYDGWTFHVGSGAAPAPVTPQATPEPASACTFAIGMTGVIFMVLRRRRQAGLPA